jgi:HK97 family phage prohead protease
MSDKTARASVLIPEANTAAHSAIAVLRDGLDTTLGEFDETGRLVLDFMAIEEMDDAIDVIEGCLAHHVLSTRSAGNILTRLQAPDVKARLQPASYDSAARTVEAVVATATPVERFDGREVLDMSAKACDLARASDGRMALLFNHDQDRPIGNVVSVSRRADALIARLAFADTKEGREAEGRVARGEMTQFSIGYRVRRWVESVSKAGERTYSAASWELLEVSLVSVPADPAAVTRSLKGAPMDQELDDTHTDTADHQIESAALATPAGVLASAAERRRCTTIAQLGATGGVPADIVDSAVRDGMSVANFRTTAITALAARQANTSHIRVDRDETETRMEGMSLEIRRALAGEDAPRHESAQRYHGLSIVEMAAHVIGHRGSVPHSISGREDILRRAFHTTSDFPLMVESAVNGRMADRYINAAPTYRQLCLQRDVSDFRPAAFYRPGDLPAPMLLGEAGEIQYGTFGESREYIAVASYARMLAIGRRLLVNDSYQAIDDILASYASRILAFEENMFWGQVRSNSAAGPTLITTGRGVFNTTDGSLASAAAAIGVASVGTGRAAMRKRKSLDGLFVGASPAFIAAGPDKESEVDALLTAIVPNQTSQVNPFPGTLTKAISPEIPGNAWYLFSDPKSVPTFIYSLLDGYKAPRLQVKDAWSSQGVEVKIEHDVGFSGVDFRGAYLNAGA